MSGWFDPIWNYLTGTKDVAITAPQSGKSTYQQGIYAPGSILFYKPSATCIHDWRRSKRGWVDKSLEKPQYNDNRCYVSRGYREWSGL